MVFVSSQRYTLPPIPISIKYLILVLQDNTVLPPPILFDEETAQLPSSKGSYMCAEEGKEIARQFLEQFYLIYDSANREPLRAAYHESAMLSMTSHVNNQTNRNNQAGYREKNT